MGTPTTVFGLTKPAVNSPTDQDLWGGQLNTDLDILDNILKGLYVVKNVNYPVVQGDTTTSFGGDCTSGNVTFTLPVTPLTGTYYSFKKIDASANTMSVIGTIDGATNFVTANQYDSIIVQYNGTSWNIVASNIEPPVVLPNVVYVQNSTITTISSVITNLTVVPKNTDGVEFMTVTITPETITSRIRIRFTTWGGTAVSNNASRLVMALFKDTDVNALCARPIFSAVGGDSPNGIIEFEHVPATTSAVTYKIRLGIDSGSSPFLVNSFGITPSFGGVAYSTLIAEEL